MARSRIDASWAGFGVTRQVQGGYCLGRSVGRRWKGGRGWEGEAEEREKWKGEDGMREVEVAGRGGEGRGGGGGEVEERGRE